jgi:hypothetical protein
MGRNAGEVLDSLKKAGSGRGSITPLDPIHRRGLPVAEIRLANDELAEIIQVVDSSLVRRTTLSGLIAAREAARQSGLDSSEKQFQTGLLVASGFPSRL